MLRISENQIVMMADTIIHSYEQEGVKAANEKWLQLDASLTDQRKQLSPEVFDLVLQLEFLLEDHPESDFSDLLRALYVAKAKQAHPSPSQR